MTSGGEAFVEGDDDFEGYACQGWKGDCEGAEGVGDGEGVGVCAVECVGGEACEG